jgi:bacteriocin biosynthesis cyclodehydratase domain-containing protein
MVDTNMTFVCRQQKNGHEKMNSRNPIKSNKVHIQSHSVVVISDHSKDGRRLVDTLVENGIDSSGGARFAVVTARDVLSPELSAINRWQLRRRSPWMLIKTAGERLWVGPIFTPGVTGCWDCLAHRLRENRLTQESAKPAPLAIFERGVEEVKNWLNPGTKRTLEGLIQEFTPAGKPLETHALTRRPHCPACGREETQGRPPIQLRSQKKIPQGTRTCSAQETLARLARHESSLTGIVARVRQAPDWQAFPTYLAVHCRPLPAGWPAGQLRPAPQPVAGKGATEEDARASCLAEAMERYSIQWQGNEPRRLSPRSHLGKKAIGFDKLALFSDAQLGGRGRWNREVGGFSLIPEIPADDGAEIEWTPVWSLTARRRKYVPTAYCYLYYPSPIYLADSNGCAAGNTIEEAILQGFLELVERDAVGIWWYNRLPRRPVQVDGPMKERYAKIRKELAGRGRTLAVLDLTTDFEIPVFAAVSARENGKEILIGTGAHLNANLALSRALGELCQVAESLGKGIGRRHGRLTTVEAALDRWLRQETLDAHPYLNPRGRGNRLSEFRDWSKRDVKDEVDWCVERARASGLEVLVLDMTRPDIDFPVVRVIVPGMRHFWGRFAPGRLYNVPVEMGWTKRALGEPELNPIAYFL